MKRGVCSIHKIPGIIGGVISILTYIVVCFFNPYASSSFDSIMILFFMLFIPACLAIYASSVTKNGLLLFCIFWSSPIIIYLSLGEGIFNYVWVNLIFYFISYISIKIKKGA